MPHTPQVENLKALTSLRFVAAFMIVLHHAPSLFTWAWPKIFPGTTVHGVSFFFVLSGFILTHVYSSKPIPSYGSFMRARFARLWPVHVVALVLLVISVTPDSITFDGPGIFSKWVVLGFNLTLLQSAFPFVSYTFSWNAVSWSISTEMFFYLAFPLLIVNIQRTWHWKVLGAAVLAAALIWFWWLMGLPLVSGEVNQATAAFGTLPNPLMRGLEFCSGMATWVLWNRHIKPMKLSLLGWSVLEAAVLAFSILWLGAAYWWPVPWISHWGMLWYGPSGSFWVFAILIAAFAGGRGIVGRALSVRPLVFLGEISFSLYMLHQVLMKAFVTTFKWPDVPEVIFFGVLLVLSSASYLLVEKPGQRLLLGRGRKSVVAAAIA